MTVQETIYSKLVGTFAPVHLEVINESHRHNVPAGSESHFKVIIVADLFDGQTLVARHRSVNSLLSDELQSGVHALSLHTKTPAEWAAQGHAVSASPPCLGGDKQNSH